MSTATQTVRIFGPNLSGAGQAKGTFHVHDIGCADCAHYGRGKKYGGDDRGWTVQASSRQAIVEDVYGDHMADAGDDANWHDYDDLYLAPCVSLPVDEPAAETIEEDPDASLASPAAPETVAVDLDLYDLARLLAAVGVMRETVPAAAQPAYDSLMTRLAVARAKVATV